MFFLFVLDEELCLKDIVVEVGVVDLEVSIRNVPTVVAKSSSGSRNPFTKFKVFVYLYQKIEFTYVGIHFTNANRVDNKNYSFSLFCMKNSFCFVARRIA